MKNGIKFLASLALPLAVGAVGGLLTRPEIAGWYRSIQKPSWQPPAGVFGPVWTTLYLLMGLAFYRVWQSPASPQQKKQAAVLWIVQLALNLCWSVLFFNRHQIGWALVEILVLWLAIVLTVFSFARVSKTAAWLMVPYAGWVSFAVLLNWALYRLNA